MVSLLLVQANPNLHKTFLVKLDRWVQFIFTSFALVFDFDKLVALLISNGFKVILQFSQ